MPLSNGHVVTAGMLPRVNSSSERVAPAGRGVAVAAAPLEAVEKYTQGGGPVELPRDHLGMLRRVVEGRQIFNPQDAVTIPHRVEAVEGQDDELASRGREAAAHST